MEVVIYLIIVFIVTTLFLGFIKGTHPEEDTIDNISPVLFLSTLWPIILSIGLIVIVFWYPAKWIFSLGKKVGSKYNNYD